MSILRYFPTWMDCPICKTTLKPQKDIFNKEFVLNYRCYLHETDYSFYFASRCSGDFTFEIYTRNFCFIIDYDNRDFYFIKLFSRDGVHYFCRTITSNDNYYNLFIDLTNYDSSWDHRALNIFKLESN